MLLAASVAKSHTKLPWERRRCHRWVSTCVARRVAAAIAAGSPRGLAILAAGDDTSTPGIATCSR